MPSARPLASISATDHVPPLTVVVAAETVAAQMVGNHDRDRGTVVAAGAVVARAADRNAVNVGDVDVRGSCERNLGDLRGGL